ncbi:DMT family transporter [Acinetobacter sp. MD2(2019)]|uniref:DMT family transporter n=1 Tax=Acinetobacter sp. MD2(2019) TaxID=2605273 RepID=UPI002D1F441C|nr:DMT family transporter [Acinetobacter sp. MD2(2019)]MEB3753179.1 DMT family transporter [Acinetobacter sp. MD2(2019)]
MQYKLNGWISGFIGVMIFSGSLPATRLAIMGFSPEFLAFGRAAIAGTIALIALSLLKQPKPNFSQFKALFMVTLGVVIGFPLCTSIALQTITASYSVVFVAILPLATAFFALLHGEQRPPLQFWIFAMLGSTIVMIFAFTQSGPSHTLAGQLWMLAAILLCGLGYAAGGKLSRELGGWQVICWALVLALPLTLVLSYSYFPQNLSHISVSALLGFLYVSLFSMLIGFVFWYHGLATGGVIGVGQLQLIQPFLGLVLCAVLLHEQISLSMIISASLVILCVSYARKAINAPVLSK